MKLSLSLWLLTLLVLLTGATGLYAQEENNQVAVQGSRYVDFKIKGLEKYNTRIERQQKRLLTKLKRKEKHFANKLKKNDSAAYSHYMEQSLSYDSIGKLANVDTGTNLAEIAKKKNGAIDSLKKIQSFADSKSSELAGSASAPVAAKSVELNKLQGELNYRNYINDLTAKRTSFLKSLASSGAIRIPGFTGIEKQAFYGKSKMKVFKEMNDDPTVAEDKAMEYLQGTEGFDKYISNSGGANGASTMSGMDASQLEKMGYQTKQQMQKSLEGKFGSNLSGVSKQMGGAMKQWQEQQNKLGEIRQAKQSLKQLKNTDKTSFKVNPMRGLPFMKRIEKQYNWQTTRAKTDGTQPALFDASAMAGFKHTPKLTYGVGIAYSEGLGQGWQKVHLSFQGVGYRTFATWAWQYGIGAYTGYERMYKKAAFLKEQPPDGDAQPTPHNSTKYTESILVGLTKSYNINSKYKGALQLLYDIWWQQKGLNNPIVLRFVTIKK